MDEVVFDKSNLDPASFAAAAAAWLAGAGPAVVLSAPSAAKFEHDRIGVLVYLDDALLRHVCAHMTKFKRDLVAIVTYGYVGSSRGGKNGVVLIPDRDSALQGMPERFCSGRYEALRRRLGLPEDPSQLVGVKVVTHRKSGERIVGVMDKMTGAVALIEVRWYNK